MKKIIIVTMLVFNLTVVFGQNEKWGSWEQSDCYKGIQFRVKLQDYNNSAKQYHWKTQIRNSYNKKVTFTYDIRDSSIDGRESINPGAISESWTLNSSNTSLSFTFSKVCFYHPEGFDSCSDYNQKGYASYADCDNGSPKYQVYDGKKVDSNSSDNSTSNNNNTSENASLQSAIDEFNSLLPDVPDDSERTNIYERVKSVLANNTTSDSSKLKEVNAAIVKFKNKLKKQTSDNSEKSAQADQQRKEQAEQQRKEEAAQKEVARLQKIKDDKRKSFDNNIASGDSALQSKNYDSALSYYSNAQTYADNDIERSFAKSKYDQAFEARRNAEREVRVAKAKKTDERENVNYAVSSTAMLGAMALLQDSYSNDGFVFKLFLGMGIDSSPLLSNNTSVYSVDKTFIEQRLAPSFDIGAKLEFLNNHSISFFLKPQMTYGMSALNEGTSGGFFSYGGVGCLSIGRHYDSKLSIFAEGGWFRRASSFEYDADAANNGTTTTDDVRSGEYNYKSIRYGGGIMLRFINNQNKETYFRPGFFYEKPDFFTTATKPILNLSMQINISSELIIEFIYAKNTFIPGEPKFPSTVIPEDKNFFGLKIIRQGNLNNL